MIDFVNSSTRILDLYSNFDLDQATYAAILTTETIVWFDPAHDGRIMLSWKHYLPKSDSLRLLVVPSAKREPLRGLCYRDDARLTRRYFCNYRNDCSCSVVEAWHTHSLSG